MKAICPNNPNHKKFVTSAHVVEEWVVDESGNFVEVLSTLETAHGPNPDNLWFCYECGTDAEVLLDEN